MVPQQQEVAKKFDIKESLKSDAWKKEKVTEITNKGDLELNEFAIEKKGANKNKKT